MKNIFTFFFLCVINLTFLHTSLVSAQRPGISMEVNTTTGSKGETLNYDAIQGSPYLYGDFTSAKALCCNEIAPMRYDLYADEVQYKKGDVIYTLLRETPYTRIEFLDSKTILVLENIDNESKYFIEVVGGKNALLKKVSKKIVSNSDPKKTGFGKKDQTSTFVENEPSFYIKAENGKTKLIKNKKDVLDLYPEKNKELNAFFDVTKIKFNKEESLAKVVNFLNN
ncbi:hypothetical protein MKS83_16885 [Chryseobacterium sp. Y16C]|uniref:hypothetical protein n=1 Tax=Chryseobacterium sp. Y16C TaxID=2920939 RepID=UPI001F0B6EB1|nr:hypothetical protein [Chryseobacterium sp. Y16C]UMQ41064.1 hypothetical protein MKS83_16885 [Chryseobacterium sp. Y16C]